VSADVTAESATIAPAEPPDAASRPQVEPSPSEPVTRRRRRFVLRWPRLGIQSKLLMMLLVTSIVSCVVVGVVGYRSGRDALREKAFDQLTFLRNSRARGITREYNRLLSNIIIYTRGKTAIDGVQALHEAFHELDDAELTPDEDEALRSYYEDVFVPRLEDNLGTTSSAEVFLPTKPAQRYLQLHYTVPYEDGEEAAEVDDAGDGSAWSEAHAEYHPFFHDLVERFGYGDALLIDEEGFVIYSAHKRVDLGTNLRAEPFDGTELAAAYVEAFEANAIDFTATTDFERYQPYYGAPSGWVVSPIGNDGRVVGALALQLPVENINAVMTGNQTWEEDGLGGSGETYLVGPDSLMRSSSRLIIQEPERYAAESIDGGTTPDVAEQAVREGSTILVQPVETPQVERALSGETGTLVARDYFGHEVLAAYTPVELGDLGWVVIAELDTSEAFEPVDDFTRRIVLATTGIIVAVALASLLLAQIFSRPVKRLMTGVRQVAAGDLGAQVQGSSTDEFADLATAFNDMSRSLRTKQELLEAEQAENERLLLTMMPPNVAERYRRGEQTISQDHQDVAVVFADIAGFDEYAAGLDSATELSQLNDLVRQFDEAAARVGVERVRTLRNGYLASCGLALPRVDNALRVLDFAREMETIVRRFNTQEGANLALRAGIDAGRVTSGLVGRASVIYDLWGEAVNLAFRVQNAVANPGIFVTQRVYDRLRDAASFEQAGSIATSGGEQPLWRVAQT
jgi:class 3 adenylate cyclase